VPSREPHETIASTPRERQFCSDSVFFELADCSYRLIAIEYAMQSCNIDAA
jgi:hypothetical protein